MHACVSKGPIGTSVALDGIKVNFFFFPPTVLLFFISAVMAKVAGRNSDDGDSDKRAERKQWRH